MLPDITAIEYQDAVIISWNSQYSDVKSIAILRSDDSLSNFATIAHMKNLDKGPGFFVIRHPHDGQNCYKLDLTFNSGLDWMSNYYCLSIDINKPGRSTGTLSFDSVKKLISAANVPATRQRSAATAANKNVGDGPVLPSTTNGPERGNASIPTNSPGAAPGKPPGSAKKNANKNTAPALSLSFEKDTNKSNVLPSTQNAASAQPKRKLKIPFQEPEENASTLVKSDLIYNDAVTGNVIINLPDDVATHHYSVKFYDDKNEMITEIPKINSPKIIVDKRNFQQKGIYKFKLRRDVVELETGYVTIVPNP